MPTGNRVPSEPILTLTSKYPPAKPGALGCEPLKAADGAANAAADRVGHLKVAISATDSLLPPRQSRGNSHWGLDRAVA